MKLKKETVQELGIILNEEFHLNLSPINLEKFAYALVGYFTLLLKAETRERNKGEFGNSSVSRIDNEIQKPEDR